MNNGELMLNNQIYLIKKAKLKIRTSEKDSNLYFAFQVETQNNSNVDYDLSYVYLYNNDDFNSGLCDIKDIKSLEGIIFDLNNYEKGFMYVVEHNLLEESKIQFLRVYDDKIKVKWYGKSYIGWNESWNKNIPFEALFIVEIPNLK